MIRIDEIYYNVFVKSLQHRPGVGLHWFDPFGSVEFKDIRNVPAIEGAALRLVFWDQEPAYLDTTKKFFDQFIHIYDGPIVMVTSEKNSSDVTELKNTYGIESAYYFFHGWAALDWYRGYNHSYLYQPWQERNIKHKFICPNNIIGGRRQHRLQVMHFLDQKNLIQGNLVSFPAICPYENLSVEFLLEKQGLPPLKSKLPLVIDQKRDHANDSHKIDFWDQAQSSFCHVVTETVYESTRLHLTEKTFKPIVLQQPFMLVAPKHSLKYLKDYGFRTFDMLWDESYDDADDDQRLVKVISNLEKINNWTVSEIADAQQAAKEAVMHNFQWFYGGFQDILWSELTDMLEPLR